MLEVDWLGIGGCVGERGTFGDWWSVVWEGGGGGWGMEDWLGVGRTQIAQAICARRHWQCMPFSHISSLMDDAALRQPNDLG